MFRLLALHHLHLGLLPSGLGKFLDVSLLELEPFVSVRIIER